MSPSKSVSSGAPRAAALLVLLACGGACVSTKKDKESAGVEATASVPSPEEVRAREEVQARARRQEFVQNELRWIVENARAHERQ